MFRVGPDEYCPFPLRHVRYMAVRPLAQPPKARKLTDTFGYCPSTRCKKTTRCNTSFCGFVGGDTEAPRGAVLWLQQRARVLEQEEGTKMGPKSEVAGREGQRGAEGMGGIEFV